MTANIQSSFVKKFLVLSGITLAGSFVVNVLNYLFTLVTGRMLGPSLFAETAALIGLFVLISVPSTTLTLYIAKEVAILNALKKYRHLSLLFKKSTLYAFGVGIVGLILFVICVPFLSSYLDITPSLLFLFSLLIPASLLWAVNLGFFQGQENFVWFSYINIFGSTLKFVLAIFAIKLGFGVPGVIFTLICSTFLPYILGSFKLVEGFRKIVDSNVGQEVGSHEDEQESVSQELSISKTPALRNFFSEFGFMFTGTLCLALLVNIDVILAKHYLSATDAGYYSALSTLGKTILYASMALVTVMFPMVSSSHTMDELGSNRPKTKQVLVVLIAVISALSLSAIAIFKILPELTVGLLFGKAYASIIPYLVTIGFAMYFLALVNGISNYCIALRNKSVAYILLISVIIQWCILTYSEHTLRGISVGLMTAEGIVLLVLTCFTFISSRRA